MTNLPFGSEIDWNKAYVEFWEKMAKSFPNTKEASDLISSLYERAWKELKPFPGIEEKIEISVDKDYKLKTSMSGWLLLGAVTVAALNMSLEKMDKSKSFQKLSKKVEDLEKELTQLKERVKNMQEYKEIA